MRERFAPVWKRLPTKIAGALAGLLLLALAAIGSTLYLSSQLDGSSAAIRDSASLRVHSDRLTILLARRMDASDRPELQSALATEMSAINAAFVALAHGEPRRPTGLPSNDSIRATFDKISQHWQTGLQPLASTIIAGPPDAGRQAWQAYQPQADDFVKQVDQLVRQIEQDGGQRTIWLRSFQWLAVALAVSVVVTLMYLLFLLMAVPMMRLRQGMQRMAEGDFSIRLTVESRDEFGQLSKDFNQLADRLQVLYGSLEDRVRIKTAALADQNRELALLYDSAAFLQLPQSLEAMCGGFLQRLRQYFEADGGSVRVLDHRHGNIHMVVHQGMPSQLMEAERCMKVGECLCGEAVEKKVSMVYDLRKIDREQKLQCHREGFTMVSAFHIHAQQQYLGMFNLHFRQQKTITEREKALLETLGQLLGIAIENLRLATREREMAMLEERNLVAQGLHDSIAQGLSFLNIQVQMLEGSLRDGKPEEAAGIVPALRAGVQESYDDVRELLQNFRTRLAEEDLIGALKSTLEKFRRQTGIEAELIANGDGVPLPREQQLQVLFIAQEALSNIRKHASASKVAVQIEDRQDFVLSIRDNGVGFDQAALEQRHDSHVGLKIMRERAQRIEATLNVTSAPGQGAVVCLQLLQEQRRAA